MSSLDKQSGAADDTNIVRIVKLETQMDNVTSALTALQRTQEQNHLAMLAQFDALRDSLNAKIDHVHDSLSAKIDHVHDSLSAKIDRGDNSLDDKIEKSNWHLINRMDRQFYWLAGLLIAQMTTTIAILLRFIGP
jgi:hypothetical protein